MPYCLDVPMLYYNWWPGYGDSGDVSHCMMLYRGPIDKTHTYQWRDNNCDDLRNYFICQNCKYTSYNDTL